MSVNNDYVNVDDRGHLDHKNDNLFLGRGGAE